MSPTDLLNEGLRTLSVSASTGLNHEEAGRHPRPILPQRTPLFSRHWPWLCFAFHYHNPLIYVRRTAMVHTVFNLAAIVALLLMCHAWP
jgi:hypothetical protein